MAGNAGSIRAGRAFVELFADDRKLVRGLRRASAKLKAFGAGVSNLGLKMAGLGAAAVAPILAALGYGGIEASVDKADTSDHEPPAEKAGE